MKWFYRVVLTEDFYNMKVEGINRRHCLGIALQIKEYSLLYYFFFLLFSAKYVMIFVT